MDVSEEDVGGELEGEMDFPDEWMVLDDADHEELPEEEQDSIKIDPACGDKVLAEGSKEQEKKGMPKQPTQTGKPSVEKKEVTQPKQQTPANKLSSTSTKKTAPAAPARQPAKPSQANQSQSAANKTPQGGAKSSQTRPNTSKEANTKGVAKPSQSATQAVKPAPGKSPAETKSDLVTTQTKSNTSKAPAKSEAPKPSGAAGQAKATSQGKLTVQTKPASSNSTAQSKAPNSAASGPSKLTGSATSGRPKPGSATPGQSKPDTVTPGQSRAVNKSATPGQMKSPPSGIQSKPTSSSTSGQSKQPTSSGTQPKATPSQSTPSSSSGQMKSTKPGQTPEDQKVNASTAGKTVEKSTPTNPARPSVTQVKSSDGKTTVQGKITIASEPKPANQTRSAPGKSIADGKSVVQAKTKSTTENKPGNQSATTTAKSAEVKNAGQEKSRQPSADRSSGKSDSKSTTSPFKDQKLSGDVMVKVKRLDEGKSDGKAIEQKDETDMGGVKRTGESGTTKKSSEASAKINVSNSDKSQNKTNNKSDGRFSSRPEDKLKKPDVANSDKSHNKASSRPDDGSSYRSEREDRPKSGTDDRYSSKYGKLSVKPRESLRGRSNDRRRSRSRSRGNSRDRNSRYGRSDDRSYSKSGGRTPTEASSSRTSLGKAAGTNTSKDRKSLETKKPVGSSNAGSRETPGSRSSKTEKAGGPKQSLPVKEEKKTLANITAEQQIVASEQLLDMKAVSMEQGLWRFSLRMSPLEFGDFAKQELRTWLNTAQDCIVVFKNQGQNKKKKGESHMYFNRLLTTKCTMQKLFQLQLTSKKLEIEIIRKLVDSKDKDSAIIELDLSAPGTLATVAATNMLMTKSAGEDKNVLISNVPKSTTQELLFVVFPTAFSIQMPRDSKDKGSVIVQFRSAQCADDVMKCYSSITINKMKLKLTRKGSSNSGTSESSERLSRRPSEPVKKPAEPSRKRKEVRDSSIPDQPRKRQAADELPQVYQIPVLNKRSGVPAVNKKGRGGGPVPSEQPEVKRPRLDQPPPPLPPGYVGFPVPTSVPPPIGVDFSVPPPALPAVGQPAWPVTSGIPMVATPMQMAGPQNVPAPASASGWQVPQREGYKVDRDLQGTEAISPEWEEDGPRLRRQEGGHGRPGQRGSGLTLKRSLSPARPYRRGSHSPDRPLRRSSRSPTKTRPRSISPSRISANRRGGYRRYSRSPEHLSRQSYSPVSSERKSRSPRRSNFSSRRPRRDNHSPISPGRFSRSPGRRGLSPKRKGRSPPRPSQPQRRRSQSPGRGGRRNYSPISQGRLSRSPGRRGPNSERPGQREFSPRKRSHSPSRKGAETRLHQNSDRQNITGRDVRKTVQEQSLTRQQYQGRSNQGHGAGSQGSSRQVFISDRHSDSPGRSNADDQAVILHRHISKALASRQSHSPHRPAENVQSNKTEGSGKVPEDRGGWTGFTSLPPSSTTFTSKTGLFPAAFAATTTSSVLFPSAKSMSIPGLDLLLAATAEKSESDSTHAIQRDKQKEEALREAALRQDALEAFGKQDVYRAKELKSGQSANRGSLQERDLSGGKQDSSADWWRRDSSSPFLDRPKSRDSGAYGAARDEQEGSGPSRDLMNLRQEAAKRLASREYQNSAAPRSQGLEHSRPHDTGRVLDSRPHIRPREVTVSSGDYRQSSLTREEPASRDQGLVHKMLPLDIRDAGGSKPPLKSALRKPTPSSEWPQTSQSGFDRPGLDRSGIDRPGMDRPGIDRCGLDRPGMDRPSPGIDRSGVDRPGMDRPGPGMDRPGMDRPGPGMDHPGMDRPGLGMDRPGPGMDRPGLGIDRPGPGMDRPGMDRAGHGIDRSGMDRPGFDRSDQDRPGFDRPRIDRPDLDRPGYDRPGLDRPDFSRPGFERPGLDHPDLDRPAFDRSGLERQDFDRPGFDRAALDRPELDRPGFERPGLDRPNFDRPGFDRPGLDRSDFDRPGLDRPDFDIPGFDRSGLNRQDFNRPGYDRPRLERPDLDRPGFERSEVDQPDLNRPGFDRPGLDQPGMERPHWQDQPGRPAEPWGERGQDWHHGPPGCKEGFDADKAVPRRQGRYPGPEFGPGGDDRDLGRGRGMPMNWEPEGRPGVERRGEGPGWQDDSRDEMERGGGRGRGGPPYGGPGSWLPPPRPLEPPPPGPRPPFMPHPPY